MNLKKLLLTIGFLVLTTDCLAVVWNHIPITITLPINKEKIIRFPNPVSLGIAAEIKGKMFVQNNAGWVYITAHKRFPTTRIEVKDTINGNIILLNLVATKNANNGTVAIKYPQDQSEDKDQIKPLQGQLAYINLIRFAQHQLYAPKRYQKNPYGIQLVHSYVNEEGKVKQQNWFYGLFMDNSTVNIPWAQWHGGDYYLTAVLVRNQLPVPIDLTQNLQLLCGRTDHTWDAVDFFPNWKLEKSGSLNDTTVAFLISKKPFEDAIKNCKGRSNA